jgi:hypothetical protein
MPTKRTQKRRDFLKTAAAGAVGITAAKFDRVFASPQAWTNGMQINAAIDNKRVICCHDTKMLPNFNASTSFSAQNNMADAARIASNMDQMAILLTQKSTASAAWSAIFQKPAGKAWADIKVAIKVNAILGSTGNHPRVAVVKKVCDVLVDQLGVLPSNIVLYDATDNAAATYTATYVSLTDATKIRATISAMAQSPLLGGMTPVTIASADHPAACVANLVNGTIDILVNMAIIKVHSGPGTSYLYGSCSLCMKNHLGTFNNADGKNGATGLHSLDAICEINKHDAVIGGTPPRQQLCIIDALLANGNSAGGSWDTRVDRIVMGTFAPTVDYLTAMRILNDVMGKPDRNNNVPKFVTNFGYSEADVQNTWIEYIPGAAGVVDPPSREYSGRFVTLALSHSSFKRALAKFIIPHTAGDLHVSILDGKGRLIRTLLASSYETIIVWDGLNNSGTSISVGNYFIKISARTLERTGTINVSK